MEAPLNWTPPFSALRKKEFPRFHKELLKHGRGDLSFKINQCGIDGIRLDCEEIGEHDGVLPVMCRRRICPQCARHDMVERIHRYSLLAHFYDPLNDHQEKFGYRLRYWTFTCLAIPGKPLKPIAIALNQSIARYWNLLYGQKSYSRGGPYDDVGGLFCIEVGEGWNVHAHALIYGPYHGTPEKPSREPISQLETCKLIWSNSLKKFGWSGEYIFVELVEDPEGSIVELVSYPLNPDKRINLDERLLAHVELAFSGRNETTDYKRITGVRRYIAKGKWYASFPPGESHLLCPECAKVGFGRQMVRETSFDDFKGHHFKPDHFRSEKRWDDRLRYFDPQKMEES